MTAPDVPPGFDGSPYGFEYQESPDVAWKPLQLNLTPAGAVEGAMKALRQGFAVRLTPGTLAEMRRHKAHG